MSEPLPHVVALNKAKIALMQHQNSAFFTTVCFSLKHIWDESIPTAATDGIEIRFNPQFFMSLTVEERVFLLLHESMHVAFLHMVRQSVRTHKKWNIACDHVINLMLIARGFHMPEHGYADPQYNGMSTEQVYDLLPDDCGENFTMDLLPPPPNLEEEELQRIVDDILVRASIQSKMAGDAPGSIPGDIEIYLDKLLKPVLPWSRILQRFLNAQAKNDYSWMKPNRRFFPRHHLPSMYSEKLIDLAIAVDTSGSVTDKEFLVFITEVNNILRMMKPDTLTLLQFDTNIKSVDKLKSMRDLAKLKFTGRGGTRIMPVYNWARDNKPQLLLIFSDGHFTMPEEKPKTNLLWVIHNNDKFTSPAGKVIHYKV